MHQRMARQHGDLSAEVADPYADWAAGGLTRQAYDYAVPALAGGLTSRIIMGESGNMHLGVNPVPELLVYAILVPNVRSYVVV
eukprot:SAG31_NODE_586_length_13839_cov_22.698544_9_plen_83_part_00